MRYLKLGLLVLFFGLFVGCTSTEENASDSQFSSEISGETQAGDENADTDDDTDTDEGDLNAAEAEDLAEADDLDAEEAEEADAPEASEEVAKDEFVGDEEEAEAEAESPPLPSEPTAEAAPEGAPATDSGESYEEQVVITGVDFKSSENGGTIVIQTNGPAQYTAKDNQKNNQYVVEIQNARLPERFKKPYNTKEFSGPVGMFQGYQPRGSDTAKFVVQLKNSTAMSVVQEGNSLLIMPGRADAIAVNEPAVTEEPSTSEGSAATAGASDEGEVDNDKALTSKTLDDFLTGDARFYGRKIDIEVKNGDVRDVLNLVSEESGLNLVVSPSVKGVVNLKLRRIPWDQALVIMLQSNQLGYVRQGNILRVAPLTEIRAEADEAKRLIESQKQLEPLKVKIFSVSYAKADELAAQVTNFLSTRGKVKNDNRTNTLVVTDINEVLTKVEKLIKRLDTQTPQVLIEARVVEAREELTKRFGLSWEPNGGFDYSRNLVTGVLTKIESIGISAELQMMENESLAKVLSAPRIVTLNNATATIDQTEQIPLETSTTVNGQTTSTITYRPIKLSLSVTPQITAEGGVIMKLDLVREFSINVPDAPAPPIFSRTASSTVLVQSGDTTVVGGIYQTDKSDANKGLPILRKIPLLGGLFGQTEILDKKNELLIFVTPRILNKEKAFGEYKEDTDTEKL